MNSHLTGIEFTERSLDVTYTVLDSNSMTVRCRYDIELQAAVRQRFYVRQFLRDSSGGIEKAPSVLSGRDENGNQRHKVLRPISHLADGKRLAVIDLGRILEPGETETVTLEYFFVSVAPSSPSYVGAVAGNGCVRISLRAVLPRTVLNGRVLRRTWLPNSDHSSSDSVVEGGRPAQIDVPNPGRWVEFDFLVEEPRAGYRYRLQWDHNV